MFFVAHTVNSWSALLIGIVNDIHILKVFDAGSKENKIILEE